MREVVVVEVDVRVAAAPQQVVREGPERALSVAAAVLPGGAVEAQVPEAASQPRRLPIDQVVLAEGGAVFVERAADLVRVPVGAAELDGVTQASAGQLLQKR